MWPSLLEIHTHADSHLRTFVVQLLCYSWIYLETTVTCNLYLQQSAASSSLDLCKFHSFIHCISSSVQLLAFPIIALERFFSISTPFDRSVQMKRVTCLNGKVLSGVLSVKGSIRLKRAYPGLFPFFCLFFIRQLTDKYFLIL